MGKGFGFLVGLAFTGLLSFGCSGTESRCESLCTVLEDCNDDIDIEDCIEECTSAFDEPSETCEVAFETVVDCIDEQEADCEDVEDDCDDESRDFFAVCDDEFGDMDLDDGPIIGDPCNDEASNSCFGFDGYCDEGTSCAAGTDYSDCYCTGI